MASLYPKSILRQVALRKRKEKVGLPLSLENDGFWPTN